ncbi:cytochrome b5 [Phaeosphaeriaceae sp. SRC1lsM3a]|nr:cytochrome b5 [Stagonospora sp. SRC1lsM3a]
MSTPARYRKPAAAAAPSDPKPVGEQDKAELKAAVKQQAAATSNRLSVLDVLRILGGILLLSSGLSYLSTNGTSMTWGYDPWWTRAREWKTLLQREVHLTDAELLAYDGSDPSKPIYLAINGTIYDVSISPSTYGPGGSYHFFAGKDAARAFLTGCFAEDSVPDLRGVEQMYMPIDPEEKEGASPEDVEKAKSRKKLTSAERKNRHAQELRSARKQVVAGLENWHQLFRGDKGKAYRKVGEVKREEGWLEKTPKRELCKQAEKSRPVRKYD